ncbi:MAG: YitT family protein [Bacilli bacterium]
MSKTTWKQVAIILIGSFILAGGVYHISFGNNLADGGFLGIAFWVQNKFGISPAVTTMLLDIPIFIISLRLLGFQFITMSVLGAGSFSLFYALFERFSPFVFDLSDSLLFASVLGGVCTGVGLGLILRAGGATGGDDILTLGLSKYSKMSVGTIYFIFDAAVILLCSVYLSVDQIFYTLVMITVSAKVTDLVYEWTPSTPTIDTTATTVRGSVA